LKLDVWLSLLEQIPKRRESNSSSVIETVYIQWYPLGSTPRGKSNSSSEIETRKVDISKLKEEG